MGAEQMPGRALIFIIGAGAEPDLENVATIAFKIKGYHDKSISVMGFLCASDGMRPRVSAI